MKRSPIIPVAAAALAALLLLASCARTPEQRAARMVERISDDLGLDDAQKARLEKIKDEIMARRMEMLAARSEAYNEIIELMTSDRIEPSRLDALAEKGRERTNDAVKFFFDKFAEFHDMLTPEQRAKVAGKLREHGEKHSRR